MDLDNFVNVLVWGDMISWIVGYGVWVTTCCSRCTSLWVIRFRMMALSWIVWWGANLWFQGIWSEWAWHSYCYTALFQYLNLLGIQMDLKFRHGYPGIDPVELLVSIVLVVLGPVYVPIQLFVYMLPQKE
jgi:hypothetical protein